MFDLKENKNMLLKDYIKSFPSKYNGILNISEEVNNLKNKNSLFYNIDAISTLSFVSTINNKLITSLDYAVSSYKEKNIVFKLDADSQNLNPYIKINFITDNEKVYLTEIIYYNVFSENNPVEFYYLLDGYNCPIIDLNLDYILEKVFNGDKLLVYSDTMNVEMKININFNKSHNSNLTNPVAEINKSGYIIYNGVKTIMSNYFSEDEDR